MTKDVLELDKDQIAEFIPNVEDKFFTDSAYAVIDKNWLVSEGYKGYRKWLGFAGLSKWKTNWDCDNLAVSFKLYMQMLHAKYNPYTFTDRWKKKGENATNVDSVAVGVIYFKIDADDRRAHAINLLICTDGYEIGQKGNRHKLKKVYFEPKGGVAIELMKKEEETIWYANF
jgi:hypothetical protein